MKGPVMVAFAAGTLAAIAFGGMAMAAVSEDPSVASVVEATDAPDASGGGTSDDASSPDTGEIETDDAGASTGLECVLVPVEDVATAGDAAGDATVTPTIDELLAANDIACTGTGNERSAEVALVPRYLAHSDDDTGAQKGLAISSWAKTHSNQTSDDAEPEAAEEGDGPDGSADPVPPSEPASPGRSGDAHGHSGSQPGNGRGR